MRACVHACMGVFVRMYVHTYTYKYITYSACMHIIIYTHTLYNTRVTLFFRIRPLGPPVPRATRPRPGRRQRVGLLGGDVEH